ncbi:MAG: molybdopterin molybdotransferase MoeA [Anaerolineales bacterium]|nr:molybdopterin molybdotransferase MoeA [Anaerolineales bacterium]
MSTLLSVDEAKRKILGNFTVLETETSPINTVYGRTLAENIVSGMDLPLFPNSSMDGYTVRSIDVEGATHDKPQTLIVVDDIPAGKVSQLTIEEGQASRIMTGAPIPAGADAVIPIEDTDQFNLGRQSEPLPLEIKVIRSIRKGDYIRQKGEDIQSGEIILSSGKRIRPQEVGLLAMLGITEIPVVRQPRIAIMSTGDELVPIDMPLQAGQIHDSNTYTLHAQIVRDGGDPIHAGIASDLESAVFDGLANAVSSEVDLILSTAGVSVGAFDFVKSVVEQNGYVEFWRVNMRPGKPLTFGYFQGIPFIGLPGNPVSAFVSYEIFVRPAIFRMSGIENADQLILQVRLIDPIESDGRESYLRAFVKRQEDQWIARLTGHQGSGNLRSLIQANALLVIPSGVKSLPSNSIVNAIMFNDFG